MIDKSKTGVHLELRRTNLYNMEFEILRDSIREEVIALLIGRSHQKSVRFALKNYKKYATGER